jgi:hypothetical protein
MMSVCALATGGGAHAQQNIGSTAQAQNNVSRELSGAAGPLNPEDPVYRNELVRTGEESTAKLIFLDSTNLAMGPTSRVTLDQFVYAGEVNGQKMTVNLAKGIFRFTTGALDKRAYTISTSTASIGVRGTVLDIAVTAGRTGVTLREGSAIVCARGGGCVELTQNGQTAQVKKHGGANTASLSSTPVNFASLCAGGSLCSGGTYASASPGSGGGGGGGFPSGALCGH